MGATGAQLKDLRERAKVSRTEMASRLGVTYSMVQRIEEGWREMPEDFEPRFRRVLVEVNEERGAVALAVA